MVKRAKLTYSGYVRGGFPALIFLLFISVIYSNTFNAPFIFDDQPHIPENANIRIDELSWKGLQEAAFNSPAKRRPVANITFALNYYLHEYKLTGYHLVNILIHIITGILLFFFMKKTLELSIPSTSNDPKSVSPDQLALNPQVIAFFATLIWLVHPLHTQSVTYIVQRMNSMAGMFYLLSLLFYVKGRLSENKKSRWLFFSGCVLSGILALGSKEIAATLPFFIILYEWYFFQNLRKEWLKRSILPLSGIIVFFIAIALLYLGVNPLDKILSGYDGREFTLLERVMTEFRVIVLYITLLLFPHPTRLNLDYDFLLSHSLINPVTTLLSLIAIVAVIVLALYIARRERLLSFCILWFFGNLVLESSVIGLELVYEHRTYLPSMMASLLIVIVVHRYLKLKLVNTALLFAIVFVFSLWTYERNIVWNDELTFWRDVVKKSPEKARPHYNLGLVLFDRGMTDEAIQNYNDALRIYPNYEKAHNNLGIALTEQGKIDKAIKHYHEALRIYPGYAKAYNNMGIALLKKGEADKAIMAYNEALRLDPTYTDVHVNWGVALASIGNLDEAVDHYSKALKEDPDCAEAHVNMGIALHRKGLSNEAMINLIKALNINPDDSEAYNNLGVVLSSMEKNDEAITQYLKALSINPTYAESHYNLGIAFAKKGMANKAIRHYQAALKIRPGYADAHNNLGVLLINKGNVQEAITHFQEALTAKSAHANAYDNLENALAAQMMAETAIEHIEEATKINPANSFLYNKLGDLYQVKGDLDKAVEQYRKVPAVHKKEFTQALNNLAIAYTTKGEYKKALSFLHRIIELKPHNPVAYYNVACIYAKQDKLEESITWLNKAIDKGFNHWEFLKTDSDLENIRGSESYRALIKNH